MNEVLFKALLISFGRLSLSVALFLFGTRNKICPQQNRMRMCSTPFFHLFILQVSSAYPLNIVPCFLCQFHNIPDFFRWDNKILVLLLLILNARFPFSFSYFQLPLRLICFGYRRNGGNMDRRR